LSTFGEGAARRHLKFRDQKPPKTRRFARSCSVFDPSIKGETDRFAYRFVKP
jgi:predicted methyltransferase